MHFKMSEVFLLIKARPRILNLKNKFKGQFKGNVLCSRLLFFLLSKLAKCGGKKVGDFFLH